MFDSGVIMLGEMLFALLTAKGLVYKSVEAYLNLHFSVFKSKYGLHLFCMISFPSIWESRSILSSPRN